MYTPIGHVLYVSRFYAVEFDDVFIKYVVSMATRYIHVPTYMYIYICIAYELSQRCVIHFKYQERPGF